MNATAPNATMLTDLPSNEMEACEMPVRFNGPFCEFTPLEICLRHLECIRKEIIRHKEKSFRLRQESEAEIARMNTWEACAVRFELVLDDLRKFENFTYFPLFESSFMQYFSAFTI